MTTFTPRVQTHRIVFIRVVAMLVAACGAEGATTTSSTSTTAAPTNTVALTTTSTTTDSSTSTTATTVSTTAAPTTSTTTGELPGEPSDLGPEAGDRLAVMGVAYDDTLNVRAAPGAQPILHQLAPTADDLIALGHTRRLPNSFWHQIQVDKVTGWVSAAFVGQPGPVGDVTASVVQQMGGIPEAGTMLDLGNMIAGALAASTSRITVTVAPTEGDPGEVTIDVVGVEDDTTSGFRLHIFGAPGGEGFYLDSVEALNFCSRGVDPQGFCV